MWQPPRARTEPWLCSCSQLPEGQLLPHYPDSTGRGCRPQPPSLLLLLSSSRSHMYRPSSKLGLGIARLGSFGPSDLPSRLCDSLFCSPSDWSRPPTFAGSVEAWKKAGVHLVLFPGIHTTTVELELAIACWVLFSNSKKHL